jgi:hypothetical protein
MRCAATWHRETPVCTEAVPGSTAMFRWGPVVAGVSFYLQRDTFKLAIQGHALLEDLIDNGIRSALPGGASREIMRLTFKTRLALAESLAIIAPPTKRLILELGRIRNEFAHGRVRELTAARARELVGPARALFPEMTGPVETLETASPHGILSAALFLAFIAGSESIHAAADDRAQREAAFQAATGPIQSALKSILDTAAVPTPDSNTPS